jgi:formate dehydrogenase
MEETCGVSTGCEFGLQRDVQPAPKDHPWRQMANPLGGGNVMTAHYSGTTLDAQSRYASGTKEIIKRYFEGSEQDPVNVIVTGGQVSRKP